MRRISVGSSSVLMLAIAAASAAGCGDSNDSASCSDSQCEPHIDSASDGGEASAGAASTSSDAAGSGGASAEVGASAGEAGSSEPVGAAGAPTDSEPCGDPGAVRCVGAAQIGYFECRGGVWQPGECVRGELCDNETGECAPVAIDCAPLEPGDAFCDGATRSVCGADLVSVERETCEHGCLDGGCITPLCGDAVVQPPEQCDDGNRKDDDDCTTSCALPECGDGYVWEGHEFCDDANDDDTDGCPANCQEPVCGDGYLVRGVETCDDSNRTSGDGCSSECRVEVSGFALGRDHSCAVLHDGRLKCWGSNEHGQLGFGAIGDVVGDSSAELGAALPAVLPGPVTRVAAGSAFTCAIVDKQLWCWGDNAHGQLGRESDAAESVQPALADLGGEVKSVCLGGSHACAIVDDGDVKCWGANDLGQSGAASDIGDQSGEMGNGLKPVPLAASAKVIGCGENFSCAILNDGRVYCWGRATMGQIGPAEVEFTSEPNLVPLARNFGEPAELALGGAHTCALSTDGEARCWGNGMYGQRASGDTGNVGLTAIEIEELPPAELGMGTVAAVAAGYTSTCSLLSDGTARCFGENNFGVLAKSGQYSEQSGNPGHLGDDETFAKPLRFETVDGIEPKVRAIDVGAYHGCALLDTGTLACWGDNGRGQLGIGTVASPNDIISDDIGELPRQALVE